LATRDHEQLQEQLLRHPRTCRRFRGQPQIPLNLAVYPENGRDTWWIVDEWTDGSTLEQNLHLGPLLAGDLPQVMRQIALGLQALHRAVVIRRELAPRNVLLRQERGAVSNTVSGTVSGTVLLTDFELGKFLDRSPTVSAEWPMDPYRAPEVGTAPHLDGRADLFSWGRICVHAATGALPPLGEDAPFLARAHLPAAVRQIVERCVQLVPDDRPAGIDEVLARPGCRRPPVGASLADRVAQKSALEEAGLVKTKYRPMGTWFSALASGCASDSRTCPQPPMRAARGPTAGEWRSGSTRTCNER
jgi:serine/threonine protein kinase